jgi:hypothetical protein
MSRPDFTPLETPQGPIHTLGRRGTSIYRVGYAPNPWEWTPWEYATDGRFAGRWDDPDGVWRTLYCGISALACYLEVCAFARPSAQLIAELDDIVADDEDEAYPTVPPGHLPRSWCEPRMVGHGTMTGRFALPADPQTLATLRSVFRPLAIRLGLDDLDTAALRDGRPRALTQAISRWIYTLTVAGTAAVAGIEFDSRHGDRLHMWALYERVGDAAVSSHIQIVEHSPIDHTDSELSQALTLLGVEWTFD